MIKEFGSAPGLVLDRILATEDLRGHLKIHPLEFTDKTLLLSCLHRTAELCSSVLGLKNVCR